MPIITAMKHKYFQRPFHHMYFEVLVVALKYVWFHVDRHLSDV
jgi:hypothetical protein